MERAGSDNRDVPVIKEPRAMYARSQPAGKEKHPAGI